MRRQPVRIGLDRVERELPAVAARRDVALQQRERRLERPALVGDVPLERRHVREAALGQEAEDLELRVHAGLDPPVELERDRLADDDRAVRLIGAHRPDRVELVGPVDEAVGAPEHDAGLVELERRPGPHQPDRLADERGVGDRVVDSPALCLGDDQFVPGVVGRAEPERQVVEVVALEPVPHLDDGEREDRRPAGRDDGVEHPGVEDVPRLAAEPALRGDRAEEDEPVEEVQVARLDPAAEIGVRAATHRPDP